MHYAPQALLSCVAWFSLLRYGNAAKGVASPELLSQFAHTVGAVLGPTFTNVQGSKVNRSTTASTNLPVYRSSVKTRQVPIQDTGPVQGLPNNRDIPFENQGIPYLNERAYQYRYSPFAQHFAQNFYPNLNAFIDQQLLPNGLPVNPQNFQQQRQLARNQQLPPIQPDVPKALDTNVSPNSNNVKENGNGNGNSVQNSETNNDSKSSAQNRPFDAADFSPLNQIGARGGGNFNPTGGNLRFDNRFSLDYDRARQNYYSDSPINQQRNYFSSFNEIPFSSGPPYRSGLAERFSNLDYNEGSGGPRVGASPGDIRTGNGVGGIGQPYFGNFLQGPYQSLNYNSLSGGGGGAEAGPSLGNFVRNSNFRSTFDGSQYPGGFNAPFYPGGNADIGGPGNLAGVGGAGNPGFNEPDSSLRASSAKETVSETENPEDSSEARESFEQEEESTSSVDRNDKVQFINEKQPDKKEKTRSET